MEKIKFSTFALIIFLTFFGLFSGKVPAQKYTDIFNQKSFNKLFEAQNYTDEYSLENSYINLINKARIEGKARIIIGFKLENYQPDAALTNAGQIEQRAAIREKQTEILDSLSNFDVQVGRQFDYIPYMSMEVSADALEILLQNPDINFIKENEMRSPSLVQSIPILGGSPFGGSTGGTFAGFSGAGRTIAILDTGVDKTHPFFNNRVVSEACYSRTTATTLSFCPGGASSSTAPGSGVNCPTNVDGCSHGTHVAGIAAGGNPLINGNGVARDANIIAVQVFSQKTNCTQNCTTAFDDDIIAGLNRVYALRTTYNIDSVNMSLGGGRNFNYCDTQQAPFKAIIDNLRAAGIVTIIASGNDGYTDSISSPACVSTAISVGSTNDGDSFPIDFVSTFSNSASILNLLAPGELIISSVPGGSYDNEQGTSMAAPMVAGAWAVMKQRFPGETIPQILTRLKYGGVQVSDSRNGLVKPRIKIDTAMNTSNVDPCGSNSPIAFGQTINGTFSNTDCLSPSGGRADIYSFNGTQGQSVAITESASTFFTYVYLFDPNFNIIGQNGNANTSRIPSGSGFLTLPSTGTYYIYATTVEGNRFGNYTVNLATNGCSFTITSSSQNFAAAGGNGNFNVNSGAGCAWSAQSNAAWLTTNSSGNGNGTVNYTVAQNNSTSQRSATITVGGQVHTVTQAGAVAPTTRRPFDFDGDGKTDISIFRPSNGQWWYLRSSDNGNRAFAFGNSSDVLAPGDFTGDGKTDITFFRPLVGEWFVLRSEDSSFFSFQFGTSGDIPAPADYDGDGKADPAVFRPSNQTWYINRSTAGSLIVQFGFSQDKPVVADYDGDGKADIAIFRPSNGQWWYLRSSDGTNRAFSFGLSTDKPVPGDYTGDGKADVAFWRPSDGFWYILRSEDSSFFSFPFGASGDIPAPGDYDGDGKFDPTVFRPSNATWYVNRSTAGLLIVGFGFSTDRPVPNAFVP